MKSHFWIPDCHKKFGQECTIYFLRLRYPSALQIAGVASIAKSACLPSYRIYPVYGPEDFIVVARASLQKHNQFLRAVEHHPSVSAIQHMECNQSFPRLDIEQRQFLASNPINTRLIERHCKADENERIDIEKECIAKKMILPVPDDPSYRFFSHFRLPPTVSTEAADPASTFARDPNHIIESFKGFSSEEGGFHVSVYVQQIDGKPREFVVETLSSHYETYYQELEKRAAIWASAKIACITYVVSAVGSIETDEIHDGRNLKPAEVRLLDFLDHPDAFRVFDSLSESKRSLVRGHFEYIEDDVEAHKHFRDTLRDLILAFLFNDREYLIKALTITVKIEGYFGLVLQLILVETLGKKGWYQRAEKEIKELAFDVAPTRMSLVQAIVVANKIPESKSRLKKEFGSDWAQRISSVADERNDFAHGRTVTDADALTEGKWTKTVETLSNISSLYTKIVEFYERSK